MRVGLTNWKFKPPKARLLNSRISPLIGSSQAYSQPRILKKDAIKRYLQHHALAAPESASLPEPSLRLKLIMVIPSLAERNSLGTVLRSLARGSERLAEAEVIVVVNNTERPDPGVLENNQGTLADLRAEKSAPLRVLGLDRATPGKWFSRETAGVGLARRVGMDLALDRLAQTGQAHRAAIACLDADSPVAPGYIDNVLAFFDQDDPPLGALSAYAHPVPADPALAEASVAYELWLRYFETGLLLAGSLFAYPTIGSCIVASPLGYALADGMPPRQAGEDFHFLQRLIKVSAPRPLARMNTTRVFPTARVSDRVLFGTGQGMQRCLSEGLDCYQQVEPPEPFLEIRQFFSDLPEGFRGLAAVREKTPPRLGAFLEAERAWPLLEKIRQNHSTVPRFLQAVQQWFDGLRIVRYVNQYARENGRVWIFDALLKVFGELQQTDRLADLTYPQPGPMDMELCRKWLGRMREM